jgi:hypothetical protein
MKIKQKLKNMALGVFFILAMSTPAIAAPVAGAAQTNPGNNGCGTSTALIKCDNVDVTKDGVENTAVFSILLTAINILTAGIGLAAIAGIIYGSALYTSAGGSPEQVKKAIEVIRNVVIGVVAYALMFSFLNFLIPGGLF